VSANRIAAVLPKGTPARRKKGFSAMRRKEHPPRRYAFPAAKAHGFPRSIHSRQKGLFAPPSLTRIKAQQL